MVFLRSFQFVWLCLGLICGDLELAPELPLVRGKLEHSLFMVFGDYGETFVVVGAFIAPHL